jgi:hypothetical protein
MAARELFNRTFSLTVLRIFMSKSKIISFVATFSIMACGGSPTGHSPIVSLPTVAPAPPVSQPPVLPPVAPPLTEPPPLEVPPISKLTASGLLPEVEKLIGAQPMTDFQRKTLFKLAKSQQEIVNNNGVFSSPGTIEANQVHFLDCMIEFGGYDEEKTYELYRGIISITFNNSGNLAARYRFYDSLAGKIIMPPVATKESCDGLKHTSSVTK